MPSPLLDRILPFSHPLSPKSIHVVGRRPLQEILDTPLNMIIKVKVILRLRSFQNEIVSVWISISKRVEGLRPNGSLFIEILLI